MDDPLPDPELEAPEGTRFRLGIGDDEVGAGTLTLRPDGERALVQEIEGEAYGRLTATVSIRFRRRGGRLLAESQNVDLRDKGRPVLVEKASFRDVEVPQSGGELAPYPRAMVPAAGLAVALRTLELGPGKRFTPHVWLAAVVFVPVDLRVEKRERVEVPAGTFDAWRVRLRPSLVAVSPALDELSASVVPPVVAHVAVEPAGRLVRLVFPTGPSRQDPRGRLEATKLS